MKADDNVVLIAGGAGALGQTVVSSFVAAGEVVIMVDQHPPSIQVEGCIAMEADVTDETDVRCLVDNVIRTRGRIDSLINLVGGFAMGRVLETDATLWDRMLTVNLTAALLLSKAVLPHMLERRMGRIVHVAARAALDPFPGAAAYIVSKSGLVALIRVLSLELAGSGVTVNGVLPTTINTLPNRSSMPDVDRSKWAQPKSVAQTLIFLTSKEASQINGALIPIG